MMNDKAVRVAMICVLIAFAFSLCVGSAAFAEIMNGKEVNAYVGHIVSHNARTREIVVKTEGSTGHWRLANHIVVFSGRERLRPSQIWGRTKRVEVFVSRDGEVQRISVLEWK